MSYDIKKTCEECTLSTMFFVDGHSFCEKHRNIYLSGKANADSGEKSVPDEESAPDEKPVTKVRKPKKTHKSKK